MFIYKTKKVISTNLLRKSLDKKFGFLVFTWPQALPCQYNDPNECFIRTLTTLKGNSKHLFKTLFIVMVIAPCNENYLHISKIFLEY